MSVFCGSRKHPYPPHEWSFGNSKEGGVSQIPGKYKAELEFLEAWEVQTKKKTPVGEGGYFLEPHIVDDVSILQG